jgi:alkylation response protein AidB-like acyl-CoA dehydrogenase
MCLTEPHCGTDLGLLRTKAEPQPDGSYKLTGSKIFISAGEHDFAANIVHLVLARLPDAPAGSKGISLFVVPKFLVKADGTLGERNPIFCTALEHKMGIHASATCQIDLDGAVGTLVGQPHKGLNAMFVMMNAARLGVGNQSLGLTEVAYQNAVAYARDRLQMRSLSGPKAPGKPADPIIVHPDVRKMLLTARAYAEGGRALAIYIALLIDKELSSDDADERKACADEVALLTPIVKAFLTDNGWIATSHCMQVFGGHGYIKSAGMEQYVRDARINMIYEGTNTIQALDLLGRKVLGDNGARLKKFGRQIAEFVEEEGTDEAMQEFVNPLADLGDKVTKLTTELGMKAFGNADEVGGAAVDYLRQEGQRRPVLHRQAAHGALLLRQAAARDGGPDPQRARRRGAVDGHGRGAVLEFKASRVQQGDRHEAHSWRLGSCVHGRCGLCSGQPGGAVEDDRRRDEAGEELGAHQRERRRAERPHREDRRPRQAGLGVRQVRGRAQGAEGAGHDHRRRREEERRRAVLGRRHHPRSQQRQDLQGAHDTQGRRQGAGSPGFHRLFLPQPAMDPRRVTQQEQT